MLRFVERDQLSMWWSGRAGNVSQVLPVIKGGN